MMALFHGSDEIPDAENVTMPTGVLQRLERRMLMEYAVTRFSGHLVDRFPKGDGHPVLVLPGFLAGPESTVYLRKFLRRLGYRAYDWRLGRNLGLRPGMEEALRVRVQALSAVHGTGVSMIGWSAGGIYAREIARALPDHTRMVITMGSPFRGNYKVTRAWKLYQLMNRNELTAEMMSDTARREREEPLSVATTCIYSRTDGIVPWECCTSLPAPLTENVEVRSTHLGYGHNLETLFVIADRLSQPEGSWQPIAARRSADAGAALAQGPG
ncbi:MAG: alpha/beta hydrolase [Candidatus Nanopelagicales bacterium]